MDDDKGTSLIFVNSAYGQVMLEQIKDKILYKEVDIEQAVVFNPSAIKSVAYNPKREHFFEEVDGMAFDRLVKKYCTDKAFVRIKRKVTFVARKILKKLGLLRVVKQILRI